MEPVTILAISASPRRAGNSERLLDETIRGALSIGAGVEKAVLSDYKIAPCRECRGCAGKGSCVVQDDFQVFYTKFLAVDRIILATPVFFMAPCAQAKALIDRCQSLWERKYRMKLRIEGRPGVKRRGFLVASAGSGLPDSFDCSRKVALYFYRTIDVEFSGDVCVNKLNGKSDVEKHPGALKSAFDLGLLAANPL
jgi:NAD(P)H-dependent FMN reductase